MEGLNGYHWTTYFPSPQNRKSKEVDIPGGTAEISATRDFKDGYYIFI